MRARDQKAVAAVYDSESLAVRIEEYLADCFAAGSPPRVSELAQRLNVGNRLINKRCLAAFGSPATVILRSRQLAYAADLLIVTDDTVGEIWRRSGFGTEKTFFRAFLRQFGTTPQEYRQANGIPAARRSRRPKARNDSGRT